MNVSATRGTLFQAFNRLLLVENALQTCLVLCGLERQHAEQPGFLGGEIVGEHGACFLECLAAADVAIVRQHPPVGDAGGNDYGGPLREDFFDGLVGGRIDVAKSAPNIVGEVGRARRRPDLHRPSREIRSHLI